MTRGEAERLINIFIGARDRANNWVTEAWVDKRQEVQEQAYAAIRESHNARERLVRALMAAPLDPAEQAIQRVKEANAKA